MLIDPAGMAALIEAVVARGYAQAQLLDRRRCEALHAACDGLPMRRARPLVGPEGKQVRQDFALTMQIPEGNPIRDLAAELEALTNAALPALTPNPLPAGIRFNDLIVQRYAAGSQGITPHRDHIRYRGLVALVSLSGRGRFFVADNRAGEGAIELPCVTGGLVLLRAPDLAGSNERPFHFLTEVTRPRISVGIRHDREAA